MAPKRNENGWTKYYLGIFHHFFHGGISFFCVKVQIHIVYNHLGGFVFRRNTSFHLRLCIHYNHTHRCLLEEIISATMESGIFRSKVSSTLLIYYEFVRSEQFDYCLCSGNIDVAGYFIRPQEQRGRYSSN